MKCISTSDCVDICKSDIFKAGRGVFANRDIKKGEIIERCPVIEIPKHDSSSLNKSILVTYLFYFGKNKERSALALGFGSIYNHAYLANAKFNIKPKERLIVFEAIKDILKGEEITIDYRNGNPNKSPLWFEVG